MTSDEAKLVERLSSEADAMPFEPYYSFGNSEMQAAYYEKRAKSLGYASFDEIFDAMWSDLEGDLPDWVKKEIQQLEQARAEAIRMFLGPLLK